MKQPIIPFTSIYFDCDSTLVDIEGLDELAGFYDKKQEVARLTAKSMSGEVKLEDVFALKLAMIRPHRRDFDRLGKLYVQHVVDDAKDTIAALKMLGKTVVIMTGNFYPAVHHLSQYLGISDDHVYANSIHFDDDGSYLTFDSRGPLSVAGGKRSMILILKREGSRVAFIGDGSTDMETRPPVDLFVGYGGVIDREVVEKHADIFVRCRSMSVLLPILLTKGEQKEILHSQYRALYRKGEKLAQTMVSVT